VRILYFLSFHNRLEFMFCAVFETHTSTINVLYVFSVFFSLWKPFAIPESVHDLVLRYTEKASRYQLLKKAYYCRQIKCIQVKLP
jgi:hypothetical protein